MPNFQQAGQSLAQEAAWEPEEEEETEDERRDRELLECEDSVLALQNHLRGALARQRKARVKAQLKLAAPIIAKLQAQVRGNASRQAIKTERKSHDKLQKWATHLQALARGNLVRKGWNEYVASVRGVEQPIIAIQAQARGRLARMRAAARGKELQRISHMVGGLQATCRGRLVRQSVKHDRVAITRPEVSSAITTLQAIARGRLQRNALRTELRAVHGHLPTFVGMQSHLRGMLVRRRQKAQEKRLDDATDYVVAIQATARGCIARRRKRVFADAAVQLAPSVASFQALARGRLAQKQHQNMQKALAKVEVAGSIGGLQAFLRTKLAKKQTHEQKKKLEFVQPDVVGFQAVARGYLARREFFEWRDYLVDPHTQGALIFLQSLSRGFIQRRKYWLRLSYLYSNQDKITKIQALWRGRQQRKMYERLITGHGVDIPTIQNYMHLLDDTETDFYDQLRIDEMRKSVVDLLRVNQTLETEVQELDTKIALILKNKMSFEDLVRAKRRHGVVAEDAFHPPGGGDPFSNIHLDRQSQRKLELFEHLFFTLQTQPQYLSRLLHKLANEEDEADRRLVEAVTLILFGFGHDKREAYLFHKFIQISVHEQILRSRSLEDLANTRFAITSVTTQFIRPTLAPYLVNVLLPHIQRVVQAEDLDLSTDPVDIYNRFINSEESLTGVRSTLPRGLTAEQVLQTHGETRALYIQHLQELRALTDMVGKSIMASIPQMPYALRLMAREALFALRVRYQCDDSLLWPVVAKAVVMPFILPAIAAPETYGIAENVNPVMRRNLNAIAHLLGLIASQDLGLTVKDRLVREPLQEYIRVAGKEMSDFIFDVAEVDFQVQEMLESTSEATPISITRSDIYGLLGILIRHQQTITAGKAKDPIESVLDQLEGPPIDYDRSNATVRVRLTNRLAQLQTSDPEIARVRELESQAKRHVLAVLRVQTGKDLYEVLLSHPTEADENRWVYEVHRDIALEQARRERHDLPPTPEDAEYQMESIRSLPFHEVKSRAIEFCMALVELGKLSREDHLQGLLVSIACDIREKHRLRQKRKVDLAAMSEAQAHLTEKRSKFDEQIQSYHDYIDTSMAALQQKKKAPILSKQYWRTFGGKKSKFGTYKYSAAELYEKGILLSVAQFSPRQFDKLHVIISSNDVGVVTLEMTGHGGAYIGKEEMRMEDLLQAQFDNNVRLDLFDSIAAFNLNTLIHQINKKFYSA